MRDAVIVSTTFYRSRGELRFNLACQFITAAVAAGYPVVIVDGSPDPSIADSMKRLGARVYPELHKGMGPSRRQAYFHATEVASQSDARAILWTEPEKVGIIESVEKICAPIYSYSGEIVIAKRSAASWESWPTFQQETERVANEAYNNLFGDGDADPMFGVVAFTVDVAMYFVIRNRLTQHVADTYIQHYAPIIARQCGERIVSVEVDMTYPPTQRAEEEGALNEAMRTKRLWQRDSLIADYIKLREE